MRAFAAVPALWLSIACGAAPPLTPASVPRPSAAPAAGVRTEVAGFGLSAEFPTAPITSTEEANNVRTVFVSRRGPQSYQVTAISTHGRDRPKDEQWYELLTKQLKLTKQRESRLGAFRGVELTGMNAGHPLVTRLFAVGDTLFIVEAIGSEGKLNEAAAQHFLDSVKLELPWRLYASPTTRFSVMVPAHAIELDKTAPEDAGRASSMAFYVGGVDQLSYWATGQELVERNPDVSAEQVLDAAMAGIQGTGTHVTWQAALEASGMRGREFLATSRGETMMGRVLLGERFLYLLLISAKSREALQAAETSKFYGSLVVY